MKTRCFTIVRSILLNFVLLGCVTMPPIEGAELDIPKIGFPDINLPIEALALFNPSLCSHRGALLAANQDFFDTSSHTLTQAKEAECTESSQYTKHKFFIDYKAAYSNLKKEFCSVGGIESHAREAAESFNKVDASVIKKHCGTMSAQRIALADRIYRSVLAKKCNASHWISQAEMDAQNNKDTASRIEEIEKCPSGSASRFTSLYLDTYNQRRSEIQTTERMNELRELEEQKLERQREERARIEELEERKYRRQREERARLEELEEERYRRQQGERARREDTERRWADRQRNEHSQTSPKIYFKSGNKELYARCKINGGEVELEVTNPNDWSTGPIPINAVWEIYVFDRDDNFLENVQIRQKRIISQSSTERERRSYRYANSDHCLIKSYDIN